MTLPSMVLDEKATTVSLLLSSRERAIDAAFLGKVATEEGPDKDDEDPE